METFRLGDNTEVTVGENDLYVSVENANPYAQVLSDMLAYLNVEIEKRELHVEGQDADTELWIAAEHDMLEEVEQYLLHQLHLVG